MDLQHRYVGRRTLCDQVEYMNRVGKNAADAAPRPPLPPKALTLRRIAGQRVRGRQYIAVHRDEEPGAGTRRQCAGFCTIVLRLQIDQAADWNTIRGADLRATEQWPKSGQRGAKPMARRRPFARRKYPER